MNVDLFTLRLPSLSAGNPFSLFLCGCDVFICRERGCVALGVELVDSGIKQSWVQVPAPWPTSGQPLHLCPLNLASLVCKMGAKMIISLGFCED